MTKDDLEARMPERIAIARSQLTNDRIPGTGFSHDPEADPPQAAEDLRPVFRKFRRIMGENGNPGTRECKGALRDGWIVTSGTVEGYGDEVFYVVMLTNGALHYFSGEITEPIEFTSKWFLGDSIPELEAKMLAGIAEILAAHDLSWELSLADRVTGA